MNATTWGDAPEYTPAEDWAWDEINERLLDAWELESWHYQQATDDPHELS